MSLKKTSLAIGLLAASVIGFQIALMHVLSIVQWDYFAYMVISIALLGFGASGTCIAIAKKFFMRHYRRIMAWLFFLTALFMTFVLVLYQHVFGAFDTYLLFHETRHVYLLVWSYLVFFLPFFFAAMAIGLSFVRHYEDIGKLYFSDLLGSGLGGALVLVLLVFFHPAKIPPLLALLPVLSLLVWVNLKKDYVGIAMVVVSLLTLSWFFISPPTLQQSEYKSLSKTLTLPNTVVTHQESSPYGLVEFVSAPSLRYAPGVSLQFQQELPVRDAVFVNGNWFGPLVPLETEGSHFLPYTTNQLAYELKDSKHVLVLEAATGMAVTHALLQQAEKVDAVETNRRVAALLKTSHAAGVDSIFNRDEVSLHALHPRNYLMTDTRSYDLIVLPTLDAFGGTSGANALQEQYLFTKEAFSDMWQKLGPEGMLTATTWMDYPARNSLRLIATFIEVLEEQGIKYPEKHLAAVRGWASITIVASKQAISSEQSAAVRNFCRSMSFDPVLLPDIHEDERMQFNHLQDYSFFSYVDQLFTEEREALYQHYDFKIRPVNDDSPFFSQFFKWSRWQHMRDMLGRDSLPFLEIGYFIVVLTLFQITAIALLLIILPLAKIKWKGRLKGFTLLYFTGLGVAYMFVEIVLIQQFINYFGNPIYAASAVISGMLICSGVGSYLSAHWQGKRNNLLVLVIIVLLLVAYAYFLTPILHTTISFSLFFKLLFSIVLIFPLAFFMGMPFPLGLQFVGRQNETFVPWAWGINGCFSVISTVVATILAVETGYQLVMLLAAAFYCFSLLAVLLVRGNGK